jgi:glycerol-3-phosphate O-acyltransferase
MTSPGASSARLPAQLVMMTPEFESAIDDLVARTGNPRAQVLRDAERALDEMVAHVGPQALKVWDRFGRWLTRAYAVDADESAMPALSVLNAQHSLVFLPNHRSYLDPLVLRSVLQKYGFDGNFTLGGNNLAMWPLSELGRNSGLIFIRRSVKGDPVYPAMLRLYLGYLIRKRANLEWYFEGGRTRTGKLRPPKMGVLRYLVDAFEAVGPESEDVYLVPVSIVYDQQAEVEALSAEETGGTKTPESLRLLVQFARAQGRRRGQVHLRFGNPMSLRAALADAASRADSTEQTEVVPRVAFEVAHQINAATPITPAALVMFALLDNEGRALTLIETLKILEPLLDYVRERQLPLTADVDLGRPRGLQRALRTLVREGVVEEFTGGLEAVYSIAEDRAHEAGFYRNTVTHYFITRAIVELVCFQVSRKRKRAQGAELASEFWERALALRDLLKYEFFFATKAEFDADLAREASVAAPGWAPETLTADLLRRGLADIPLLLAHRVIGPFLDAYAIVADRLATREPAAPIDTDALIAESLGVAHQRWRQRLLHSPESISKDLMSGAIKLAANRGLLGTGGEELRQARQEFAAELTQVVEAIAELRTLALAKDLKAIARLAFKSEVQRGFG